MLTEMLYRSVKLFVGEHIPETWCTRILDGESVDIRCFTGTVGLVLTAGTKMTPDEHSRVIT